MTLHTLGISKFLLAIIVTILLQSKANSQNNIIVTSNSGRLKGIGVKRDHQTVWQFRKIPYAKPPTGKLRFEKPQAFGSWPGLLDATEYGPSCMQVIPEIIKKVLPNKEISEDCLFLNIYVPRNISKQNRLSVMIWIHGGGYQTGEGMYYQANYLSLRGNVIVITINYRLNMFGFLSTGDTILPGNYGLWDQRLAIIWVKNNIEAFGGNPSSITIFGESAGGWSVGLQSIYPENTGLFSRAIMESGVGNSVIAATQKCVMASKGVSTILRCNLSDRKAYVDCLKNVSAVAIMESAKTFKNSSFNVKYINFDLYFAPVIDNDFIKDNPIKLITDPSTSSYKFFRSLDVMIGNMNAEGSLLLEYMKAYEEAYSFNIKDGIPNSFVCDVIALSIADEYFGGKDSVSKAICAKYSADDKSDLVTQGRLAVDLYGDAFFVSPAVQALNAHANGNSGTKTYQFMFSLKPVFWKLGLPSWFLRAGHFSEIPYLFDVVFDFAPYDPYIKDADLKLSEVMLQYWSNFAKTGDPNSVTVPKWEKYKLDDFTYVNFDYNITEHQRIYADRVKFWLEDLPNITTSSLFGLH